MKTMFRIAAVAVVSSALSAFAGGGNHGGGGGAVSGSGGGHSSSSASSVPSGVSMPSGVSSRMGGMPHYSGQMPTSYRPTVTYRSNGTRSLNYPAVHGSNTHRSVNSNLTGSNNKARVLRHNGNQLQTTNAKFQRSKNNVHQGPATLARSENLNRKPGHHEHAGAVNLNARNRIDPQSSARLRNWHGNVSSTAQAQQKHWDNCHHHHNHDWWHNHCVAFIFWDWGWWGWWDGWWYPAWGYDPYSYYGYNEPIYGYGDLAPEQIVAGVQGALQERGYYTYAIDGQMGPLTREAIARYQRDHRLPITYGIDPATLGSLGIVH